MRLLITILSLFIPVLVFDCLPMEKDIPRAQSKDFSLTMITADYLAKKNPRSFSQLLSQISESCSGPLAAAYGYEESRDLITYERVFFQKMHSVSLLPSKASIYRSPPPKTAQKKRLIDLFENRYLFSYGYACLPLVLGCNRPPERGDFRDYYNQSMSEENFFRQDTPFLPIRIRSRNCAPFWHYSQDGQAYFDHLAENSASFDVCACDHKEPLYTTSRTILDSLYYRMCHLIKLQSHLFGKEPHVPLSEKDYPVSMWITFRHWDNYQKFWEKEFGYISDKDVPNTMDVYYATREAVYCCEQDKNLENPHANEIMELEKLKAAAKKKFDDLQARDIGYDKQNRNPSDEEKKEHRLAYHEYMRLKDKHNLLLGETTDLNNEKGWSPQLTKKLPMTVQGKIWDISVDTYGQHIWVLEGNRLITFDVATQKQELIFTIPPIPEIPAANQKPEPANFHLLERRGDSPEEAKQEKEPNQSARVQYAEQNLNLSEAIESEGENQLQPQQKCQNPDIPEFMHVFTLSEDENFALFGGSKGTVLFADLRKKHCYILDRVPGCEIGNIHWIENRIIIVSRSAAIKSYCLTIVDELGNQQYPLINKGKS